MTWRCANWPRYNTVVIDEMLTLKSYLYRKYGGNIIHVHHRGQKMFFNGFADILDIKNHEGKHKY